MKRISSINSELSNVLKIKKKDELFVNLVNEQLKELSEEIDNFNRKQPEKREFDNCFNVLNELKSNIETVKKLKKPVLNPLSDKILKKIDSIANKSITSLNDKRLENETTRGPCFFNYVRSIWHTGSSKLKSSVFGVEKYNKEIFTELYCDENIQNNLIHFLSNLQQYAKQFGSGSLDAFFYFLNKSKKQEVNLMQQFYYPVYPSIQTLNQEKVLAQINEFIDQIKEVDKPIVIPIVYFTSVLNVLEAQHIAVIQIQNNQIEYYDPRGESPEKRNLAEKSTMMSILQGISKKMFEKTNRMHTILVNKEMHQNYDSHLCGLFVMHYVYKRLVEKASPDAVFTKDIYEQIEHFRMHLTTDIIKLAKIIKYKSDLEETTMREIAELTKSTEIFALDSDDDKTENSDDEFVLLKKTD